MPSTEQEWRKRVRGAQRALRDAKRSRRYVFVGQLMGGVVAVAALVLGIVFAQIGWTFLVLLGLAMLAIASAMAAEWTLYQDVTDARDRVEDLTEDYEAWKMEQATAAVNTFGTR